LKKNSSVENAKLAWFVMLVAYSICITNKLDPGGGARVIAPSRKISLTMSPKKILEENV